MGRGGLCACPTEVTHNRSPRTKWPGGGVSKGVLEQYSGDVTIDWCPVEAPLKAQPETGMWVQVFYLGGELGGKGERGVCVLGGRKPIKGVLVNYGHLVLGASGTLRGATRMPFRTVCPEHGLVSIDP